MGAARLGFAQEDIGTHSLCSGRVMAMHLAKVPERTLMAIARWRLLRFMVYIQWQISSFSTGVFVKMRQQPWFWHLCATLPSTEPSTDQRFPHHPIPDPSGGPSDTPSVTAQAILRLMTPAHHSHSFAPNILRHDRTRVRLKNFNKNPEHITKLGSIQISQTIHPSTSPSSDPTENFQGNLRLMTRVPFHFIFQPPARLDCRIGVRLEISNQTPYHIAQLRFVSKFSQISSMARPEHIPSYHPSKFPLCAPSHTPSSNSLPSIPLAHTHPTAHLNHPPAFLPLAPPQLHLTHGLYQAALGGHPGHTALAFKAESHSQVQSRVHSRMKWCIQLCAGVKKRL